MKKLIIGFMALAGLIVSACGGNGDGATSTPASRTPTITAGQPVQISSLGAAAATPLTSLTISGTGLTQTGSAVSVRFIPASGSQPITLPVSLPSQTNLQVMVPLFLDATSGNPLSSTVDVQVIQVTGSTLRTSNLIKGLQVGTLPPPQAGEPAGTKTLALLKTTLKVFQSTRTALSKDPKASRIVQAMPIYEANLNALIAAVGTITQIPGQTFTFSTSSGTALTLDTKALAVSDQMAQALVAELASKTQTPAAGAAPDKLSDRVASPNFALYANCPAYPDDPAAYDTNLCWLERFFLNLVPGENPAVVDQMNKTLANLVVATLPVPPHMAEQLIAGILGTFGVSFVTTGLPPSGGDVVEGMGAMDAWAKTNGKIGFTYDIYKIFQLAATTFPSKGGVAPVAMVVSDHAGNTYVLNRDGSTLVQIPAVSGAFSIDSLALVVPPGGTVTPSKGSIYDGTYTGVFTYEYQEEKYEDGKLVQSPWAAKSLTLTVTFKLVNEMDYYGRKTAILQIANVYVNDPAFGTGLSGIDLPLGSGAAYLPTDPPTTSSNPSTNAMFIVIHFPNRAEFATPALAGALSVSANGKTLSNSTDPSFQNKTWAASVPQGRLGWSGDPKATLNYRYTGWTLTKKLTE